MSDFQRHPMDISQVRCPDSCNRPGAQKGCHFRMSAEAFTCAKCQLKIRRLYSGCVLNAADLQEMLHGEKITSGFKQLKFKDGTESSARLMLDQTYRICLAPKTKAVSKEETQELCPRCGARLLLVTKGDGSKYYGCSGYPKCTYATKYAPHAFNRQPQEPRDTPETAAQPAPAKNTADLVAGQSLLLQPAEPDPNATKGPLLDPSGKPETDGVPYSDDQLPGSLIFSDPLLALPSDIPEPLIPPPPPAAGRFQRIPNFVKTLLGLREEALEPAQLEIEAEPPAPSRKLAEGGFLDPEICLPCHPELARTDLASQQLSATRPMAPVSPAEAGPTSPSMSLS